jgi:uncharacterized membrane protein
MYSKARVAGHPVHPMLVAFPIVCYVGTLVGFAIYVADGQLFWLRLGIALSIAGAGLAVLAALPGFIDWAFGIPRASGAKPVGMIHGGLNLVAAGLVAATAYSYARDFNGPLVDGILGLALAATAVALTLPAGALGWTLVQTYHVGVRLTDAQAIDETAVQAHRLVPANRKRATV